MGTEVLRPQDCLAERFHVSPSTFHHANGIINTKNNHFNNNINNYGYRKPQPVRTDTKRKFRPQEIIIPTRIPSFDNFKVFSKHTRNYTNQNNEFCNRNVSILRRGASLDALNQKIKKDNSNNKIKNKARISSPTDQEMSPTHIQFGFAESTYAGSAFSLSPPPSDLPLPNFFRKQSFDDSATRDLRRLLRLE